MAADTQHYGSAQETQSRTTPRVETRTAETVPGRTIRVVRLRVTADQRNAMATAIRLGRSTSSE